MTSTDAFSFAGREPRRGGLTLPALPARWLSPLMLLLAWEAASRAGLIPPRVLAAPSAVAEAGWELARSGELFGNLAVSLGRVAAGLGLGVAAGVALALVAGLRRAGEAAVDPLMQIKRTLPLVALAPLFIVRFGIG